MVLIPTPTGGHYCIDSTEITQAQYLEFLNTDPPNGTQIPECLWNTSFTPQSKPAGNCEDPGGAFDPSGTPSRPVVCVDWCDAYAYCNRIGKRLCGKIEGGSADPAKLASAGESEWFNACSKGGTLAYPYGDAFVNGLCRTAGWPVGPTVPTCVGGYAGLFDMSGNAEEWLDGCDADACPTQGGTAISPKDFVRCDTVAMNPKSKANGWIGLRCCADVGGGK